MNFFLEYLTQQDISIISKLATALLPQYRDFDVGHDILNTEEKRIIDALKINTKGTSVDLKHTDISTEKLEHFIRDVNVATLHFSGNCALLSTIVMYNLLNRHNSFLAASNTYPILTGVSESVASKLLLGQDLTQYGYRCNSIDALETQILECYIATGKQVFTISATEYRVPIVGETGHDFNAVVLMDKDGNPRVQFVDAWKTSDHLPSKDNLINKYSGENPIYEVLYCENEELIRDIAQIKSALYEGKETSMQKFKREVRLMGDDGKDVAPDQNLL